MNLVIPTVGSEQGPQYGFDINSSFTLVDQHDHTPGKGVQITPAALNINADVDFNSHSILNALTITMANSGTAAASGPALSIALGGESPPRQDLWYTDDTGAQIQITKNGIVNVVASAIPGESYAAGTFFWTQAQDSLPTTPANFDIGNIILRPNTALTTFGVQLQPASAIASQYSINLPLIPVAKRILTLDTSGNMVADTTVDNSTVEIVSNVIQVKDQGITAAKIQDHTLTTTQISLTAGITKGQLAAAALQTTTVSLTPVVASFAVRVATTANGTLSTAFANGQTVDGVVLATNDLILLKNQTNAPDDGVYVVQSSGNPVRSTSYDTFGELNYAAVSVTAGTVNTGLSYYQNNVLTSLSDAQSWSLASSQAFTVPAGVNRLSVVAAGGGGGGGTGAMVVTNAGVGVQGGSGGSGSAPQLIELDVSPGDILSCTIGNGGAGAPARTAGTGNGTAGTNGGNTTIVSGANKHYIFAGGTGGLAGQQVATDSAGTPATWGPTGSISTGGGGGAGAGTNINGNPGLSGGATTYCSLTSSGAAGNTSALAKGAGGGGGGGSGYAIGGNGGAGQVISPSPSAGADAAASSAAGGGGSGAFSTNVGGSNLVNKGGNGGSGVIIISYLVGG